MASILKTYEQLRPSAQYATRQWLKDRYEKLSVRSRNCIPGSGEIQKALTLADSVGSDRELLGIKNCGAKTLLEIKRYIGDIKEQIDSIYRNSMNDGIAMCEPNEKQIYDLIEEFPFLTLEECRKISNFMAASGNLPFIYIIRKYVEAQFLKDRNIEIICRHYAVMPESTPDQMDQLAACYDMTRERVRQIICKGIHLPEKLGQELNRHIVSNLDKINSLEMPMWKELAEKYSLDSSPRDVAVLSCAVLSNYTLIQLEAGDYEYLVCRDILKNSTLKTAFAKLKLLLAQRRTDTEVFSIVEFLCNGNKTYHPEYNLLKSIIASYVRRNFSLEVEDDDRIIAEPNKIDNFEAMESVLMKHGKPMSAEEMWEAFQKEYPGAGIKKFTSFKAYLIMNPKILARGKTGTYAHSEWDHYFVGSITEFVAHTILERRQRVRIEELIQLIGHEYGEISRNNLIATLRMDHNHEYVIYDDDSISLRGAGIDDSGVNERKVFHRIPFNKRMDSLREFTTEFHRLPYSSDDEREATLSRWIYNMNNRKIDATQSEYDQYLEFMKECSHLPQNRLEFRCQQKCRLLMELLIPGDDNSHKLTPKERFWIRKSIRERKNFAETDSRCRYIDELESHLDKIGYKI